MCREQRPFPPSTRPVGISVGVVARDAAEWRRALAPPPRCPFPPRLSCPEAARGAPPGPGHAFPPSLCELFSPAGVRAFSLPATAALAAPPRAVLSPTRPVHRRRGGFLAEIRLSSTHSSAAIFILSTRGAGVWGQTARATLPRRWHGLARENGSPEAQSRFQPARDVPRPPRSSWLGPPAWSESGRSGLRAGARRSGRR